MRLLMCGVFGQLQAVCCCCCCWVRCTGRITEVMSASLSFPNTVVQVCSANMYCMHDPVPTGVCGLNRLLLFAQGGFIWLFYGSKSLPKEERPPHPLRR